MPQPDPVEDRRARWIACASNRSMASRSCSLPLAFPGSLMTPSERSSSSSRGHAPESVSNRLRTAQLVLIRAPVLRRTISVRRERASSVGPVSMHSRLMSECSRFVPTPELAEGVWKSSVGLVEGDDGTAVLAPSAAAGSSNRDNGLGFIDCWSGLAICTSPRHGWEARVRS